MSHRRVSRRLAGIDPAATPCHAKAMPASPARQLACEILLLVEEHGGYASDLLHSQRTRALAPADRRLATELVMGVLRWRAALDYVIGRAARRPIAQIPLLPRTALRLGAYQLRMLDRVPASAAVHESVELAKAEGPKAAGFVNAVLRHVSRAPLAGLLANETELARRREAEFSHPAWMLERWSRFYSPEAAAAMAEYDNAPPPVACWPPQPVAGVEFAPGQLLRTARRVKAGELTQTPAFRSGRMWIQDEASQLIAHLVQPVACGRILDVCAAPGSKTALLAALAPEAQIFALERHVRRAQLLARRLRRAGASDRVQIVAADATAPWPLTGRFDRILVDAPCTGTGTLARNPEIRWRVQPQDPERLAQLQLSILRRAAGGLAPGGRLIYSVCSMEPEEGPDVITALLAVCPQLRVLPAIEVLATIADLRVPAAALTEGPWLRVLPGRFATDGFFAAVLTAASS